MKLNSKSHRAKKALRPPMYGELVKEQRGQLLSTSVSSVKLWLNALSQILPGPGQTCYTLPATGRDAPTFGYYLNNMEFLMGFRERKLSGKK
jgi:hypothetical protein